MTIKVFGSITDTQPAEVYHDYGLTVDDFFAGQSEKYRDAHSHPFSCVINGKLIPADQWSTTVINERDSIEIRLLPRGGGGGILDAAFPFWSGSVSAGRAAVKKIINSVIEKPDTSTGVGVSGSEISVADLKANVARRGQIIPEGLGRYLRYPDYLNNVRRYFKDTRTQCIDVLLCVGWGEYQPEFSSLRVGNTAVSSLTVDYDYFDPGESVAGHPAHENWYPSDEVGSTTGSTGIRLYRGRSLSAGVLAGSVSTDGFDILGVFPGDWEVGDYLSYAPVQSVDILSDVLTGDFSEFAPGDAMRIRSDEYPSASGDYTVATISSDQTEVTLLTSGGSPAVFIDGTYDLYITRGDYEYRITEILPAGFTVSLYIAGTEDTGWSGFATESTTADVLLAARSESDGWAGPYVSVPYGETTDAIEFSVMGTNGLGKINDDGDVEPITRTIEMQYRAVGDTVWTSETYEISGATRDQLGWTFRKTLPSAIRPEIRLRRVEEENTETNYLDRLEWISLYSRLPTVTTYPGASVLAITLEGTESLASLSENQINLIVTRKLQPYTGGALAATRSIADAVYYIAQSVGYTDAEIDLDELARLDAIWTGRGETFDYFFSETTVKDAIDTVLTAGYSALTVDFGVLRPVRDEPRTVFEQGYSPENMRQQLRRVFTARQIDDFDGVQVEYTNQETWTTETVDCLLPGDSGVKLDKITLHGAYTQTQAWRIGMRRRRAQVYRRWSYEFGTELDSLVSNYLSYCPLVDNVPGYGKAALMRAIYADRVVLSEPLEWESGADHVIAYRRADGTVAGPYAATPGPDDYTVMCSIPQPWPINLPDREQVHFYFGTTERWSFPALITDITPQGRYSVSVTATNYDVRVYADDDSAPE